MNLALTRSKLWEFHWVSCNFNISTHLAHPNCNIGGELRESQDDYRLTSDSVIYVMVVEDLYLEITDAAVVGISIVAIVNYSISTFLLYGRY